MFGFTPLATTPFASLGAGGIFAAFVNESVSVVDQYVGNLVLNEDIAEVLGVFDLFEAQTNFITQLSDDIDVEDAYNVQIDFIIAINEAAGFTDSFFGIKLWEPPNSGSNSLWTNINSPQGDGWTTINTSQNITWTDITSTG